MAGKISRFLQSKIIEGNFPSAVHLVAERGKVVFQDALGFAVNELGKIGADIDTIYDLASLTKPLVTGLICAKLTEEGEIHLSDKLARFFPEFDTTEKQGITVENLLTHTSGFKAWKPFYLLESKKQPKDNVFSQIVSESLENSIASKVVYSDFNFLMLGFLIEKFYNKSLCDVAKEVIFEPLDLKNTFFNPPKSVQNKIAASEKGNGYERKTCLELGYIKPSATVDGSDQFRSQIIWGEVHDNNCFFMNGVAGHAGLFSNVDEVFKIVRQFLAESTTLLKPETCKLFTTNLTPNLNQARSIAFQLAETEDSTASEALSKDSFGHLGFTGTSLWIEPRAERIFILLTNRTHDRILPFADLKTTRQEFHRIATKLLNE